MASHELKTPLTAIMGFTELLEKRARLIKDPKIRLYIAAMGTEVDRLYGLVHDMLDTSKIRAGKLEIFRSRFDIGNLIDEITTDMRLLDTKRPIVAAHPSPLYVQGDRLRINQVLTNFLTNAVKYSPKNSIVNVSASKTGQHVTVSVQDFGIGIAKNQHQRIFDPFYQGKSPYQLGRGLGLGLYICAQIIKLHKGKIWVESQPGVGSTFFFSLPRS
ncbi:HAMP domain-containing histidine kinase [Candidatus Microgenomates bacterium]|nr:HAMP domain-containing histidine kinase [Candidatus Microgenomates bacterium]